MFKNFTQNFRRQIVIGGGIFMLLTIVSVTFAEQQEKPKPISAEKAKLIGYVENYFTHNFLNNNMKAQKSLVEWGDVTTDRNGNSTIRCKYEALFTFDKDGNLVSQNEVPLKEISSAKEAKAQIKSIAFKKQLFIEQEAIAKQKYDAVVSNVRAGNKESDKVTQAESRYEWMLKRIALSEFLLNIATNEQEKSRFTNEIKESCKEAYIAAKVAKDTFQELFNAGNKSLVEKASADMRFSEAKLKIFDAYPDDNFDEFQKIDKMERINISYWDKASEISANQAK